MYLTPIESVIPVRSSLSYLDDIDARNRATTKRLTSEDLAVKTAASGVNQKILPMQFRKKETEEQQQARLNSFSYLQRQVDDEEWIDLVHYSPSV
jgi:hypothetical protein